MLGLLAAGVSALAVAASSPFLLKALAKGDTLVTEVPEGAAKAIVKGQTFSRFIMSYENHHLNDPRALWYDDKLPEWEVIRHLPKEADDYQNHSRLLDWLGLFWVGLPPFREVHKYDFRWNEMKLNTSESDEKKGHEGVASRNCKTDFVYVNDFAYVIYLDAAESDDSIPLTLQYQLVVRVNNPYKALFNTDEWLQVITGIANRRARNYVGSRKYDQLLSETDKQNLETDDVEKRPDEFSHQLVRLTYELTDDEKLDDESKKKKYERGLLGRYGVTIVSANLQTLEVVAPEGVKNDVLKSTMEKFTADRKAYSIRKEAEASADAILFEGTARAKVISLTGKAEAEALDYRLSVLHDEGKLGELLVQTDAMKADVSGKTVIWAQNPFIRDAGLSDLLEASGLTTEQLQARIRNMIAESRKEEAS